MKMHPVSSSNIAHVGHDPTTNTLAVTYKNGDTWNYGGISAAQHNTLMHAPSMGSYMHTHIKPAATKTEKLQ